MLNFFWSVFSRIQTEYGKMQTRKNLKLEHFSSSYIYHDHNINLACCWYKFRGSLTYFVPMFSFISILSSILQLSKFPEKTNISHPLIRIRTCSYQGVRNVRFSGNFECCRIMKSIEINGNSGTKWYLHKCCVWATRA